MDISTYIKMCDCPEIKMLKHQPIAGDSYVYKRYGKYKWQATINGQNKHIMMGHPIWLPKQEDVQKIIGIMDGYDFYHSFVNKVFTNGMYAYYRFLTPSQIWLAFYMQKKHSKTWDGKEWIKEIKS